jgi:hypothetical protein
MNLNNNVVQKSPYIKKKGENKCNLTCGICSCSFHICCCKMKNHTTYGTAFLNNQQPVAKYMFPNRTFTPGIVNISVQTIKWVWNVKHMG